MHPGFVLARTATKFVVGHCVSKVTAEVILHNVRAPENRKEKIRLVIATGAIGGLVADIAKERIHKEFDEIHDFVLKLKSGELKDEIKDTWAEATVEQPTPDVKDDETPPFAPPVD